MAKLGEAIINMIRLAVQSTDPATPASGYWQLYMKSDGLYAKSSSGSVIGPFATSTAGGSGFTQGARVNNSADISLNNGSDTALTFNTEDFDTDTIHDLSTNTGRLTCKTAGKYLIGADVKYTTGAVNIQLIIKLNGTTVIGQDGGRATVSSGPTAKITVATVYSLAVNDYVELIAYAEGASMKAVYVSGNSPVFWMQRVG